LNSKLFVGDDVSLNNKLFVANDMSLNSKLFVGDDVSLNNKLFVVNDVSLNSKLFVANDVSLNSKLFVANDVSFTNNLSVTNDIFATTFSNANWTMSNTSVGHSSCLYKGFYQSLDETIINGSGDSNTPFKPIRFNINDNTKMIIDICGNVGIGTTTPRSILDISGDLTVKDIHIGYGHYDSSTNLAVGVNALNSTTEDGIYNTAFGYNSGTNITSGKQNVFV